MWILGLWEQFENPKKIDSIVLVKIKDSHVIEDIELML